MCTNIFHMLTGELTIALEDMWYILRLLIEGAPVVGLANEMDRDAVAIYIVRY